MLAPAHTCNVKPPLGANSFHPVFSDVPEGSHECSSHVSSWKQLLLHQESQAPWGTIASLLPVTGHSHQRSRAIMVPAPNDQDGVGKNTSLPRIILPQRHLKWCCLHLRVLQCFIKEIDEQINRLTSCTLNGSRPLPTSGLRISKTWPHNRRCAGWITKAGPSARVGGSLQGPLLSSPWWDN